MTRFHGPLAALDDHPYDIVGAKSRSAVWLGGVIWRLHPRADRAKFVLSVANKPTIRREGRQA
jgi:hypothetical protein